MTAVAAAPLPSPLPKGQREASRRAEFHPLTVAEIRKETDEAVSLTLHVPEGLQEQFRFMHGQYLTLRAKVNDEELRRPYSVCTAPEENKLQVCVKKLHEGRFSTFVNEVLKAGDTIDVMPPMGRFYVDADPSAVRHYVAFAGGSGITPVMSNIRTVLRRETKSAFTLFYGNRTSRSIIFRDQLADLKDRYIGRFRVFHILSDEIPDIGLFGGLMDEAKVKELAASLIDVESIDWFFICGPGPMMDGTTAALASLGVPESKIKIESFGNRPFASQMAGPASEADSSSTAAVEVKLRGFRTRIRVPYEGQPILDAVHAAKIDAPYACKGGVCCSCRAKLMEGEVAMDVVYGLEPDEIAAGYILTCQSHPRTAKLVVDYDA